MELWHVVLLSMIEGITEFLPISSTGHLILASQLLHITPTEFTKTFEIVIQLGAILAVVVLYFKFLWQNKKLWPKIIVGFLPTAAIGLVVYPFVKDVLLGSSFITAISLLIGGIFLIYFDKSFKKEGAKTLNHLTYKQAALIGLIQSISIIPGVSRAAATIIGGLYLGLSKQEAIKFSFFLAIPTMIAASGLDLLKSGFNLASSEYLYLTVGFGVAFVTALLVIKYFLKYIAHHNFTAFGIYRIVLALLFLAVVSSGL